MALVLNEEQRLLKDTAKEFIQSSAPVEALRKLRDERNELGYSQELWNQMVELGWTGIHLPEAYGGLEFGFTGLGMVLEETGRTLAASPLFSSIVLGASAIELAGNESQKETLLPQVIAGEFTLALALEESHKHAPDNIKTTAEKTENGWLINGEKTFVLDGHSAGKLIVVARTSGDNPSSEGISLFLVDANTAGITRTRTIMVDSRNAARIKFDNVTVEADALLGEADTAYTALEQTLDRGRIALAAEMFGSILEAFDRTVEYLKEREQFGVKIGSFQALKHRAAIMFTEIELSRSILLEALSSVDEKPETVAVKASMAKAKLNEVFKLVTDEATQLHGGIGVTDELEIGFFLKRSRAALQILGDTDYHLDRYARLKGF